METLKDAVRVVTDHPVESLVVTNTLTAGVLFYGWAKRRGGLVKAVKSALFSVVKAVPGVQGAVDAKKEAIAKELEEDMTRDTKDMKRFLELPAEGLSAAEVTELVTKLADVETAKWASGKVSGGIYHGGRDLVALSAMTFERFALANPLHADLFPCTRKMDAEVVSMVLNLFHGGATGCGTSSSGGTESILLACKGYRDWAYSRGITEPEMVLPTTAHAAFDKACHYFGIRMVHVPVDKVTFRADVAAMRAAINSNTMMIVGSACSFPQGVIDPISELAALAKEKGIPMHVDCCLGSFVVALANEAGFDDVPVIDFRNEGVTSISCDTHKFGFAPKGTSVIMYRSPEWRKWQYFVAPGWSGGIYASPTIAGSRPGAMLACTWTTMVHLGRRGYVDSVRTIIGGARRIAEASRSIEGLKVLGDPKLSVVCFGADETKGKDDAFVYRLASAMGTRGWNLNVLQHPASFHLCVTFANAPRVDEFITDLREMTADVSANPDKYKGGKGAIYGTAAVAPEELVSDLTSTFLDALYKA